MEQQPDGRCEDEHRECPAADAAAQAEFFAERGVFDFDGESLNQKEQRRQAVPAAGWDGNDEVMYEAAEQEHAPEGRRRPQPFADRPEDDAEPTGKALESFANCIRDGKKPLSNYENGKSSAICVAKANEAMIREEMMDLKMAYSMG